MEGGSAGEDTGALDVGMRGEHDRETNTEKEGRGQRGERRIKGGIIEDRKGEEKRAKNPISARLASFIELHTRRISFLL